MKNYVTYKFLTDNFKNRICVSHHGIYCLLYYTNPTFYLANKHNKSCDIYVVNKDTCIITGFRKQGWINPSYAIMEEWNLCAKNYLDTVAYDTPRDEKEDHISSLLTEFISLVLTENNTTPEDTHKIIIPQTRYQKINSILKIPITKEHMASSMCEIFACEYCPARILCTNTNNGFLRWLDEDVKMGN